MFRIDLDKNPNVKAKLQALVGSKVDLSKLAVFEGLANDTLPIEKGPSFYRNARMSGDYLNEMADKVQSGEYVPIIKLHDSYSSLPVGRIFDAATFDSNEGEGEKDLHILFYVDEKAEPDLASSLETGSVAEISTGTSPSSLQCSTCGYDFLASEDNQKRLWAGKDYTPLCSEGHQWGVGGNTLKLAKLGSWKETSAVTRGAVKRAHVLNDNERRLSANTTQINLSASELSDKLLLVTLDAGNGTPNGVPNLPIIENGTTPMSKIELELAEYSKFVIAQGKADDLTAKLATAETAKTEAETAKTEAETAKTEAETKLAEVQEKLTQAEEAKVAAEAKLAAATNPGGKATPVEGSGDNTPKNFNPTTLQDPSYYQV